MEARFLEMLLAGASREELDAVVEGSDDPGAAELRDQHATALRIHEQMARLRSREAELSALYETARDLSAIRDLDQVLAAIVRRARTLLHADMTYLSLNDAADGASFMKVTDGALTPAFRRLRLPLGTGLLGLVAQSGEPYFTDDYQADQRFVHRDFIDEAVAGEHIRAILGVPLIVEDNVIGALLAVHRTVRPFPPGEVALLTSFAAHAAVALENARLFERVAAANDELRERSEATERAAAAHDALTDVLLHGGDVVEVADVLARVLGGRLSIFDEEHRLLAGAEVPVADDVVRQARASGRCVRTDDGAWVAVAAAGEEHLGTLVLGTEGPMDLPERRTLERGALVAALVLLFGRTEAEAESRVRGELLADLLGGRDPDRAMERARLRGLRLDGELSVAVAEVDDADRHRAGRAVAALATEQQGIGGVVEDRVVLVEPDGDAPAVGGRLHDRLATLAREVTVGVSAGGEPESLRSAWREATTSLDALVRLGRRGEVSDPAGLGFARLLLGDHGEAELDAFVRRTLGPVIDYDAERGTRLVETLGAWLDAGGGVREAAEALHVHANTVTQRLDRVGRLLGADWRQPQRRLDVHLALQMLRLRREV